ncbi:MAG: AAA family ATPase [Mycobacteriales bacterium]
MLEKPSHVFDRAAEWRALAQFVDRVGQRPQFGVVSGRRRQGKTYLLESLATASGGFYFGATEATQTDSLSQLTAALSAYLGLPIPLRFADWSEAVSFLFAESRLRSAPVVIDEFPFLSKAAPSLPSILQHAIDRTAIPREGPSLLICGSAQSVMGRLLSGQAPLRGRANLELRLRPFEYRLAAQYWGIDDPKLAVMVHAIVGGTPAYREFVSADAPADLEDFDGWVLRTVLNPTTPLFPEARYQMAEEVNDHRETGLYPSVLAAIATGNNTRGGIANAVGRKSSDLTHYLNVLEDTGLITRAQDAFRSGRSSYRIAEPLITFHQAIARTELGPLEAGRAAAVWARKRPQFLAQVLGPHFEALCRSYTELAAAQLFGAEAGQVLSGVVTDHTRRSQIEIDVVVFGAPQAGEPQRILALGEAKWGTILGARHIERLRRARDLLAERGYDTRDTTLVGYSAAGFEAGLSEAGLSRSGERVKLIGLADLYAPV